MWSLWPGATMRPLRGNCQGKYRTPRLTYRRLDLVEGSEQDWGNFSASATGLGWVLLGYSSCPNYLLNMNALKTLYSSTAGADFPVFLLLVCSVLALALVINWITAVLLRPNGFILLNWKWCRYHMKKWHKNLPQMNLPGATQQNVGP